MEMYSQRPKKSQILCRICGEALSPEPLSILDPLFPSRSSNPNLHVFAKHYCESCGVVQMERFPEPEALREHYNQEYRANDELLEHASQTHGLPVQTQWSRFSYLRFQNYLDVMQKTPLPLPSKNSYLVDIGGYQGFFAFAAKQVLNCRAHVTDFSESGIKWARGAMGVEGTISADVCTDTYGQLADVVTVVHVLEHLEKPVQFLEHIRKAVLNPAGHIYIEVPNIFGFPTSDPTHLFDFDANSLRHLLTKAGFQILTMQVHGNPKLNISVDNDDMVISCIAVPAPPGKELPNLPTPKKFNDFRRLLKNHLHRTTCTIFARKSGRLLIAATRAWLGLMVTITIWITGRDPRNLISYSR